MSLHLVKEIMVDGLAVFGIYTIARYCVKSAIMYWRWKWTK